LGELARRGLRARRAGAALGGLPELAGGLGRYFGLSNGERPHQALGYRTPAEVYRAGRGPAG